MKAVERVGGRWMGCGFLAVALLIGAIATPQGLEAQYFGKNKVQYDDFDFRVLKTYNFNIHYYPEEGEAIQDLARMSERWYERLGRALQHQFDEPKPLIIYADHPDFQQTNTLQQFIGEGTGGVTESLKNRVILPMAGSYADTDHVLGHELVHAFQYNIAQSRRGGGLQALYSLPLWLVEGMAEYLSVGREDALTAMWLRDAIRRDDFPTIEQMTRESRFFPYRFGQALWAYIGGEYGDEAVFETFRRSLRVGFQPALAQVVGVSADTLSEQWRRRVAQSYVPLMTGRADPDSAGTVLLAPSTGSGRQNLAPVLSPDGRYIAYLSEKDLFSIDLFMADAKTGRVIRKLASAGSDTHSDAIRYIESAGTWSPDGEQFAYLVFAGGDTEVVIVRTSDGDRVRRIRPEGLGAINNPTWSPDGRYLAFTGIKGGISDLYLYDLQGDILTQLTDDKHADFHPTFSPDGNTIAFSSDRGPETSFEDLTYSDFQLSFLDLRTREVEVMPVFGNIRHSNPQYSPDGRSLYFLSDQDGFADIYRIDLESRALRRMTRVATGVSGITAQAPAISVAGQTGELAFSVFTEFEFHILTLPADWEGDPIGLAVDDAAGSRGRQLPPANPAAFSRVASYLGDATTGLPPQGSFQTVDATDYQSSLSLDFIGQPSIGVGTGQFGNYVGGGASAFFSDMLGDEFLGVALQAQGSLKDFGGQVSYFDLSDRWNWGLSGGRIPFLVLRGQFSQEGGGQTFSTIKQRIFVTSASGLVAYPFSSSRRLEFSGGLVRYSYDVEEDRLLLDQFGRPIRIDRVDRPDLEDQLDPQTFVNVSAAYVGDNSFFGFTAPVRGGRFRLEAQATTGTENFFTATLDWRRYFQPNRNFTVALRGMHVGRYGLDPNRETDQDNPTLLSVGVQPLFIGYETLIRGYSWESFDDDECFLSAIVASQTNQETTSSCPVFDRMLGDRIGVLNFEVRVPVLGVEQFGLINFPFVPTDLVFFADAGLAWDQNSDLDGIDLFSRSIVKRVPLTSTGLGARFNILGIVVLEAYYAKPWQRPSKDWHWGFVLAPGW